MQKTACPFVRKCGAQSKGICKTTNITTIISLILEVSDAE